MPGQYFKKVLVAVAIVLAVPGGLPRGQNDFITWGLPSLRVAI